MVFTASLVPAFAAMAWELGKERLAKIVPHFDPSVFQLSYDCADASILVELKK